MNNFRHFKLGILWDRYKDKPVFYNLGIGLTSGVGLGMYRGHIVNTKKIDRTSSEYPNTFSAGYHIFRSDVVLPAILGTLSSYLVLPYPYWLYRTCVDNRTIANMTSEEVGMFNTRAKIASTLNAMPDLKHLKRVDSYINNFPHPKK